MDLPARERSFYTAAPLAEVICQVRYPRVLDIDQALPVSFQKAVLDDYPILETRNVVSLQIESAVSGGVSNPFITSVAYDFFDEARQTKITLTSKFIAITTAKYVNWEDFGERSKLALRSLLDTYDVRFFERVGLRYQNVIRPSQLGLVSDVSELLAKEVLGPASVMPRLREHQSTTLFKTDEISIANLRVALSHEADPPSQVCVVDCDVFSENQMKAELDGAAKLLDTLHGHASTIFRWCIQQPLHDALGPQPCG